MDALASFRQLLLQDAAVQRALGALERHDAFVPRACAEAAARGLTLSPDAVSAALHPDPLGLSAPPVIFTHDWPPAGWRPIGVLRGADGRIVVDWAFFGDVPLAEPFFEMSARAVRRLPFNRLCRWRTTLEDFLAAAPDDAPAPRGLVFHMSRCGSTLVAQMLAAAQHHIVLSEAPPVDAMVRLREFLPTACDDDRRRALVAMTAALGRRVAGAGDLFVKLDSWHSIALPLFRAAFPQTPWVFLYRDPVEVLVSQMRARGMQTVPGLLPAELQGEGDAEPLGPEDFCAQVLAKGCAAAIEHYSGGGGLFVDYADLPEAFFTKILPHFGLSPSSADSAAMRAAAQRDAKAPQFTFSPDADEKRAAATAAIRAAARSRLGTLYGELDTLRRKANGGD